MERFVAVMLLATLLSGTSSRAEGEMSMETSWDNVPRCVGRIGKNATMTIRNAPRGTKFISATLTFGTRELGGERIPFPDNGIIAEGAVHLMAPCPPGTYRWTISAEDAHGGVLGTVHKNMDFP
jgi:hypothetical protein